LEYVSSNWRPPEPLDVGQFSTEVENIIQLETKRKAVALVVDVVILSLDHAYDAHKRTGVTYSKDNVVVAVKGGPVMRLRQRLMTVRTTMIGLVPLLWATGTGADVMKRIAAPMVSGFVMSTFLTLEIIPVIYTYWRVWQLRRGLR